MPIESDTKQARLVAIEYDDSEEASERELRESQRFRDFLPTKNGCMVFGLVGHDNTGEADDG